MSDRDENLRDYLVLLRRFGISPVELARLHWAESTEPPDVPPERIVAHRIEDEARTIESLYSRLQQVLADSSIGMELPAGATPSEFERALQGAFQQHAVDIEMEPIADPALDSVGEGDPIDVLLTDRHGNTRSTTDAYPGQAELPELVGILERELLGDVDVTFVRLESQDDCERILLLSGPRLDALREKYGERVSFRDRPLLAERHPTDFVRTGAVAEGSAVSDESNEPTAENAGESAVEGPIGAEGETESVENDTSTGESNWLTEDAVDLGDVGFEPATTEASSSESTDEASDEVEQVDIDQAFAEIESAASEMDWGAATSEAETDPSPSQSAAEPEPTPSFSDEVLEDVPERAPVDVTDPTATEEDRDEGPPESSETDPQAGDGKGISSPSISPGTSPTSAIRPIQVSPAEDPRPAITAVLAPSNRAPGGSVDRPHPATSDISVSPSSDPQPATERTEGVRADEPVPEHAAELVPETVPKSSRADVTPADDPEPAAERIATNPGTTVESAITDIDVRPGTEVRPAVQRGPEPTPSVAPGESPRPALSRIGILPNPSPIPATSHIAVMPGSDPTPATQDHGTTLPITPGENPVPAVHRRIQAKGEGSTTPAEPDGVDSRAADTSTQGPDSTTSIVDLHASERESVPSDLDSEPRESEPAITPGDSPTSAVHRIEVTPGDDLTAAVIWAPFVYSPRTPPKGPDADEDETPSDEPKGVVERVTGWLEDRL